jgi:hypothetical protein
MRQASVREPSSSAPVGGPARIRASVADLTFAFWVLFIPLLAHGSLVNSDGDLARHIVTGRHILAHGPRFADPFSFTRAGEPFLAYEWLSQVIYATTYAVGGLPAIAVLAGTLIAAALALVVSFIRRPGGDPWLALVTGVAAAGLTFPHWMARPHLFTFVALPLLLHLLTRPGRPTESAGPAPARMLWLVPLFVVWANLHPGFLYGLVMIALWSAGTAVEAVRAGTPAGRAAGRGGLPFVLALGASFVNPFGWTLHTHALVLMRSETVTVVNEFLPLNVTSAYGLMFLTVCGLLVLALAASRAWVGWPVVLVLGAAAVGALAVKRNVPMFALFALPLTARALAPVVAGLPRWAFGRARAGLARLDGPGWKVGAGALALLLVLAVADARTARMDLLPDDFSPRVFPAAAVAHARTAGLEGRLLSEYTWGGYVLFTWPGQRVFIDSMADFFGDDLVRDYMDLHYTRRDWEQTLARHDFHMVLFPPGAPLTGALRDRPGWRVAYEDEVAVLFVRDAGPAGPFEGG